MITDTDEFMVTVIDNPSAKKYSLVGKYTLKVNNSEIMLYSANGLIPTKFSVPIMQIWRVKLAPSSDKDGIYSNFIVLDITGYDFVCITIKYITIYVNNKKYFREYYIILLSQ